MPGEFDDLIPETTPATAGVFDDLVPVTPGRNAEQAELNPAPEPSAWQRVKRGATAVREQLSPLLGPTPDQRLRESMTDAEGRAVYKPMGGDAEQIGLLPALSKPMIPIPKFQADRADGLATAAGKAIVNTGSGFLEFLESPLGLATGGASASGGMLGRTVAGGYALDMAANLPGQIKQARDTSLPLQERMEGGLGAAAGALLVPALGAHAAGIKLKARPGAPAEAKATVSEFGGEAAAPAADPATAAAGEFADLVPAPASADVQTSGPATPTTVPADEAAPAGTTVLADRKQYPVVEVPLKDLKLSEDVPNFKADADPDTGVVAGQKLEGSYERLGTGAITVYERANGDQEVISGRHRFDLAKRAGEETIPAQVVKEKDGFTPQMAMTLDAEMNIRDGQGSIGDYANYFRNSDVTPEQAKARGLLSRQKGQAGWILGKQAGDDLYALYRAGKIDENQSVAIAKAAPQEDALQRVGAKAAMNGAGPQELQNFIQAVRLKTKHLPLAQLDLFGADDTAMNEAQALAKVATTLQRNLDKEIKSTDNAARNAEGAKAKGISFDRDPQEILRENAMLRVQRNAWDNWALHPEMVAQVLEESGVKQPDPVAPVPPTTPDGSAPTQAAKSLEEKLDSLKVDTTGMLLEGVTGLPVWLWNGSIDVIKLAVRGGKKLAEAIEDGIDWLKTNHPQHAFDADQYREAVQNTYGLREFGQKIQADPGVTPAAKAQVSEYVYEKRSNESDVQAANRLVQEHGLDGALKIYQDESIAMPGAVRTMLGKSLVKQLGAAELVARGKGDTATADTRLKQQVDLIDHDLRRSTDVAQALQAMGVYGDMSPAGMLQHARQVFGDAGERVMKTLRPVAEAIRKGFAKANEEATRAVVKDPEVNRQAREAVNEHIEESPETRWAVIVDLAGAVAESPEIVRQAREALRGRLNEILQKRQPGLAVQSKAELATILEGLAKRVADIAAGHYQGAELGKTLAQKIAERTGLDEKASQRLAESLDKQFAKMVEEARKKIPERIAAQRARQAEPFDPNEFNQNAVDAEIRKQLRAMNLKLGDLVKQHGDTVDAAGRTIGERVVKDSGLTGPRADAMREAFDKRFAELAGAEKKKLIKQMLQDGVIPPKMRNAMEALIKATNLGAFDDAAFYDALRKKLDLPELTPELTREIVSRANAIQKLPEGFLRDRASVQLLNFIAGQRPLKIWELPLSIWYANVLSGFTTPVHIMIDNLDMLAGNTMVALLRNPGAIGQTLPALGRGLVKGALQSREILRTGIVTGVQGAVHTSHLLELDPFKGPAAALNYWKYVGRMLSATHVLMFKPALELKQALVATDVARRQGLSGQAMRQRVADILGNSEAREIAARAQASSEGLTGLDARRRAGEIIEQSRETSAPGITESARDYALRSTYLNEPYGALGWVVKGINTTINGIGEDHAKLGFVPKMLVPFTRIVGNIINEKLNWSPVGAYRAMRGMQTGELYGKPITDSAAVGDLLAKSMVGTAAVAGLTAAAAQYLHDEDPKFAITGAGPATAGQRKQLQAAGWRPHAIKIGDRYFDYLRTPMAVPLAVVGNYLDASRYRHLDDVDAVNRVAFVLKGTGDVIVHQSFLDSVAKLFEAVGNENTKTGGQQFANTLARAGSSFAVPNAIMQIDRAFDPTRYDDKDITSMLRAQIPFVRRMNKPALNVLGDPVEFGVFDRDYGRTAPDELWKVLTAKQAWIPEAPREAIVGDKKRGPDHYRVLTPDEHYDFVQESGQRIRNRLEPKIGRLDAMEPDQARKLVDQIVSEQRKNVLATFGR